MNRIFFITVLFIINASCNSNTQSKVEKRKYYIITYRNEQSITGSNYERVARVDSGDYESDSAAFWDGVISYTAGLRSQKVLKEKGIKNPPILTKDFDVLDSNQSSIIDRISPLEISKAQDFIKSNQ